MHLGLHLGLHSFVPYVLYAGAIVAFLLSVFWRPQIGVYYLVWLLPLQTVRYLLHPFPQGELFVDWMLLGVVLGLLRRGESIVPKTPLNWLLVIFGLFSYLSLWRGSFYLGASMPWWFNDRRLQDWKNDMAMFLLLPLVLSSIKSRKQLMLLLVLMAGSVVLLNGSFYRTTRGRDFSHFNEELRYQGAMGWAGSNGLAAFEAQAGIFLLALAAFEKRRLLKLGYLGLALSAVYCLLFCFSRGGYVAFLCGWLFLGVFKERKLLIVLALFAVVWQAVVPTSVQERIFMTYQGGELDHSAESRVILWDDAIRAFEGDPLFGTGFNTYAGMGRVGPYRDTHNLYLKILVEIGIVGLSMFLWMLAKMYRLGYGLFRFAKDPLLASLGLGFAGWMVCVFVANFFGDRWNYLQISGFTWTLAAVVVRAYTLAEQEEGAQPAEAAAIEEREPQLVGAPAV